MYCHYETMNDDTSLGISNITHYLLATSMESLGASGLFFLIQDSYECHGSENFMNLKYFIEIQVRTLVATFKNHALTAVPQTFWKQFTWNIQI